MGIQSLRKCAVTTPQEIPGFKSKKQAEERGHEKYVYSPASVMVIRWISIFFCLAFWYGVYRLLQLLISSWNT